MHHTLPMSSARVMGSQLIYPGLAHAPEFHGQPADPSPPDPSNDGQLIAPSETPAPGTPTEATEAISVETVSQPMGTPDGLGEALFTILVAVPWLLIALRMQLHPQTRL